MNLNQDNQIDVLVDSANNSAVVKKGKKYFKFYAIFYLTTLLIGFTYFYHSFTTKRPNIIHKSNQKEKEQYSFVKVYDRLNSKITSKDDVNKYLETLGIKQYNIIVKYAKSVDNKSEYAPFMYMIHSTKIPKIYYNKENNTTVLYGDPDILVNNAFCSSTYKNEVKLHLEDYNDLELNKEHYVNCMYIPKNIKTITTKDNKKGVVLLTIDGHIKTLDKFIDVYVNHHEIKVVFSPEIIYYRARHTGYLFYNLLNTTISQGDLDNMYKSNGTNVNSTYFKMNNFIGESSTGGSNKIVSRLKKFEI